jgi:diphosphomevalonate decarboxylase
VPHSLSIVRKAILAKDFTAFGDTIERDAIAMHCVAMTSYIKSNNWLSGIYYWQASTMHIIQTIQKWRHEGLEVYLTIDAGPNVHLICEKKAFPALEKRLKLYLQEIGGEYLVSEPSYGASIVD